MQHGIDTEPVARAIYEKEKGVLMPSVLGEHDKYEFLKVSLDGMNGKVGLEIKCPSSPKDHDLAAQGQIPEKYYWQLVHQAHVADLEYIDYMSYFRGHHVILRFDRILKSEKELVKTELEFWDMVKSKTPPEATESDYQLITSPEMVAFADLFKSNKVLIDSLVEQQDELKKKLGGLTSGDPVLCGGIAIQVITRKGNVNYKAIPELKTIDLEQYRGKATTYVDVRLKRGKNE
jgi:predicted phage-related endonuclease